MKAGAEKPTDNCLTIGSTILLQLDDRSGFISASEELSPQIRSEQLQPGVECPPDLTSCLFEVTIKFQYIEMSKYLLEKERGNQETSPKQKRTARKSSKVNPSAKLETLDEEGKPSRRGSAVSATSTAKARAATQAATQAHHESLPLLEEAAAHEAQSNLEEYIHATGEPVLYGQQVQLRHVGSGKFLSIKKTASVVEKGTLQIVLDATGDPMSAFTLASAYRTKTEGMPVCHGEAVTFFSADFAGMGIHCSEVPVTNPLMLPFQQHQYVKTTWEITASQQTSSVKIVPFTQSHAHNPELGKVLCGYSIVTIHDLQGDANQLDSLTILSNSDHKPLFKSCDEGTSVGGNLWRMEPVNLKSGGGMPIGANAPVRLRHLVTGQYLTIAGGGALSPRKSREDAGVAISRAYADPTCEWGLMPLSLEEKPAMEMEQHQIFAYLKHSEGLWLTSSEEELPSTDEELKRIVKRPVLIEQRLDRNAMVIRTMKESLVSKVLQVCAAKEVLVHFANELKLTKLPSETELIAATKDLKTSADVRKNETWKMLISTTGHTLRKVMGANVAVVNHTLPELIKRMDYSLALTTEDKDAPRAYQELCQEVGLVDAVTEIMQACPMKVFFFNPIIKNSALGKEVVACGTACHRLLQSVCKNNQALQLYISEHHMKAISNHLGGPVKAADTLASVYANNIKLVQQATDVTLVDFVNLIKKFGRLPRFMNFLYQMCGSPDRPVLKNQNMLLDILMRDPRAIFFSVVTTTQSSAGLGKEAPCWKIVVGALGQEVTVDTAQLADASNDKTKGEIWEWDRTEQVFAEEPRFPPFIYHVMSLHFICAMCYGRNNLTRTAFIEMSREHGFGLEFNTLLASVNNAALPNVLRSTLMRVLMALYIDVNPYMPLALPKMTRLMMRQAGPAGRLSAVAKNIKENTHIPQVLHSTMLLLESLPNSKVNMDPVYELNEDAVDILPGRRVANQKQRVGSGPAPPSPTDGYRGSERFRIFVSKHPKFLELVQSRLEGKGSKNAPAIQSTLHGVLGMPLAELVTSTEELNLSPQECTVGQNSLILQLLKASLTMMKLGMVPLKSSFFRLMMMRAKDMLRCYDCLPLDDLARFKASYSTNMVMEAKLVILHMFEFAMDMHNEYQSAHFFDAFCRDQNGDDVHDGHDERALGNDLKEPLLKHGAAPPAQQPATAGKIVKFLEKESNMLLKLDPAGKGWDQDQMVFSIMSNISELVRYEHGGLVIKAYELMDRLLSRRKKLVSGLMNTFIIVDPNLIAVSARIQELMGLALHNYQYIASLDPAEKAAACHVVQSCFMELTSFLKLDTQITLSEDGLRILPPQGAASAAGPGDEVDPYDDLDNFEDAMQKNVIKITVTMASNIQYILSDLRAQDVALKFIKLPLRRKPSGSYFLMPDALDPARREIFNDAFQFLRHFMIVGELGAAGHVNAANQALMLPHLDLFCSHLGIKGLLIADTLAAMFIRNPSAAAQNGGLVLRTFMQLIRQYGERRKGHWLNLIRAIMVVDGLPIKVNQNTVLQLVREHEEEILECFASPEGRAKCVSLMAQDEHLVGMDDPAVRAQGSYLGYHVACVRLLSDACVGKEPTLIVQSTGYLHMSDIMEMMLMPTGSVQPGTLHFVHLPYWEMLHHAYFLPDTENTRKQVQETDNRIWPSEKAKESDDPFGDVTASDVDRQQFVMQKLLDIGREKAEATKDRGPDSLMALVVREMQMMAMEPKGALSNHGSSTYYLMDTVFPALTSYFEKHYSLHVLKLPEMHLELLKELLEGLVKYMSTIRSAGQSAGSRADRKRALKTSRTLLAAVTTAAPGMLEEMPELASSVYARSSFHGASSVGTSKDTMAVLSANVARDWSALVVEVAELLGTRIDPATNEAIEYKEFQEEGGPLLELKFGAAFMMARFLAQPYGQLMNDTTPELHCEEVLLRLCTMFANNLWRADSTPVMLLCKQLKAMAAALLIDDGYGSNAGWISGWNKLGLLQAKEGEVAAREPSTQVMLWRQSKYNTLGVTMLAVKMMASTNIYIAFEATQLLIKLLGDGHRPVQDTVHELLSEGEAWSTQLFVNIRENFMRCMEQIETMKNAKSASNTADDEEMEEDEETEDSTFTVKTVELNAAKNAVTYSEVQVRALSKLVAGSHLPLQRLLQRQRAMQSVDVMLEAVALLSNLQNVVLESFIKQDPTLPDLMVSIFEFLGAMVQGPCTSNQEVLTSPQSSLVALCNRVLGYVEYNARVNIKPHVCAMKCKLKTAMLHLLISLLEGVKNPETVTRLVELMDFRAIEKQVTRLYTMLGLGAEPAFFEDTLLVRGFDGGQTPVNGLLRAELLLLCMFLLKLKSVSNKEGILPWLLEVYSAEDVKDVPAEVLGEHAPAAAKMHAFLQSKIGYVEVIFEGAVEPCFFLLTETCSALSSRKMWKADVSEKLQQHVSPESRSEPSAKAGELSVVLQDFASDLGDTKRKASEEQSPLMLWLGSMSQYQKHLELASGHLSMGAICLLALLPTKNVEWYGDNYSIMVLFFQAPWWNFLVLALQVAQFACCSVMFGARCLDDFALYIRKERERLTQEEERKEAQRREEAEAAEDAKDTKAAAECGDEGDAGILGIAPPPSEDTGAQLLFDGDWISAYMRLAYNLNFWYSSLLQVASVLSLLVSPFFLCVSLLTYFVQSESGCTIVTAVTRVSGTLSGTFILGMLSIFVYGVVAYTVFRNDECPEGEGHEQCVEEQLENMVQCETLYQCIMSFMLAGIAQGDISQQYHEEIWEDAPKYVTENMWIQTRSWMIILFIVIWQFVLLNIIVGLLASAFEAIRDDQITISEDSKSCCLICSRSLHDFDALSTETRSGFKHHVEVHHNPIAYVFYLHYLEETPLNDLTGPDRMVKQTMREGITPEDRAAWLPVNRALSLRMQEAEENGEQQKQMMMLETVMQRQQALENKLNALTKASQQASTTDTATSEQTLRMLAQISAFQAEMGARLGMTGPGLAMK